VPKVKFSVTLKKNHEFRRLYAKGKSVSSGFAVLYVRRNGRAQNRVGITVSTKLGGAVTRNRIRRRFREVYRLNEDRLRFGYDLVIVARSRSYDAKFASLEKDFLRLCEKLSLLSFREDTGDMPAGTL
jgi:ribonuclease P protein component